MVEKQFLEYIENAIKEYNEYQRLDKREEFSFSDFLLIICTWKMEQILEKLEMKKR